MTALVFSQPLSVVRSTHKQLAQPELHKQVQLEQTHGYSVSIYWFSRSADGFCCQIELLC